MARTISDEELQLKRRARRRLIGAIVLVTAIIVVLPMVLDSEPRQTTGQEVSVQIPAPDSGGFTSKVVPLTPASGSKPDAKAPTGKSAATPPVNEPNKAAAAAVSAPVAPLPPPVAKEAPKEATKQASKEISKPVGKAAATEPVKAAPVKETAKPPVKSAKTAPKSKDGKFVVQVIALADAGRAKQMQQQIAAAGIKSYTEVVKTAKGDVTRVRAGPFASRGAAEKAREQLKALGMNGNVTTK